jgi:hypothetical protein
MANEDFEKVAAQLFQQGRMGAPWQGMAGAVGAPWAGMAGPNILWPPPNAAQLQALQQQAQAPAMGAAQAQQAPPGLQPQPVFWQPQDFKNAANSYFGLSSTTAANNVIPANSSATFKLIPERPFLPLQLIFISRITGILIQQISMSNTNYMSHQNGFGMPVEVFSEPSQVMGLNWGMINTSTGVSLQLFNTNGTDQQMLAGFAGIQLQQG